MNTAASPDLSIASFWASDRAIVHLRQIAQLAAIASFAMSGCFSDPGVEASEDESSSGSDGSGEGASASSTSAGPSTSGSGSAGSQGDASESDGGSSEEGSTSAVGSESSDGGSVGSDDGGSSESTGGDLLDEVYGPCTEACNNSPVVGCTMCAGADCPNGGGVCTSACEVANDCPPPGPDGWVACIIGNCYLACDVWSCPQGMTCATVNLDGPKEVCVWLDQ